MLADLAPDQQAAVFLERDAEFPQDGFRLRRNTGEQRRSAGLVGARADQLAGGPLAEHGVNRVDDDRLARAGLAGQHGEARLKIDRGPLDHRDVVDVKLCQHRQTPPISF